MTGVDMGSIMVSWHTCYNLVKALSTEFLGLYLNIKPDDKFLPYSMPEVFNETEHGFTDIIIARDEFTPVLHPEFFWA